MATSMPTPTPAAKNSTKTGLQLTLLTDDVGDDDIECDCDFDNGRPANHQQGVTCNTCGKWQHYTCMVGAKPLTAADVNHGFQCRLCRRAKRSEAAKKGYQNRLIAQGSSPSTGTQPSIKPSAAATASSRRSEAAKKGYQNRLHAQGTPLSKRSEAAKKGYQNRLIKQAASLNIGSASTGLRGSSVKPLSKFKLPKLQSTPAGKYTQSRDESDEEELLHHKQTRPGGYTTRSKLALKANTPQVDLPREATPKKTLADVIDEWKNTSPSVRISRPKTLIETFEQWKTQPMQRKISCDCPGKPSANIDNYIICTSCIRLQHKDCMLGTAKEQGILKGDFCKDCRRKTYQRQLKIFVEKQRRARALLRMQHYHVTKFCEEVLWKQYCQLPAGEAPARLQELTSMYYENGRMLPSHPAPKVWVTEIRSRLVKMTAAAGEKKIKEMRGPDGASLIYSEQSMVAWRKLAVWIINHGAYKGKREELGVLAEVLGLEEKGSIFKVEQT